MKKIVHVAVAIIDFGEKYLLGYRNASQHQGEKYEFIGGKIEQDELPKQGLIREVFEEIGCDISGNTAMKMGVIRHDYLDKSVALHCFKTELTQTQFDSLQGGTGKEGQAITWVEKMDLLAKKYPLPDANTRILDWLKLPNIIFISQALQNFESENAWLNFYINKLPQNAYFYFRPQCEESQYISLLQAFLTMREDIRILAKYAFIKTIRSNRAFDNANLIIHLTHQEIVHLNKSALPIGEKFFVSCHDRLSVQSCDELAETHNVMGCFLSPVLSTPTHPETIANGGMGWEKFAELAEMSDVPVYGLGGLGQGDLEKVWENNGFGVAGIRLIKDFS